MSNPPRRRNSVALALVTVSLVGAAGMPAGADPAEPAVVIVPVDPVVEIFDGGSLGPTADVEPAGPVNGELGESGMAALVIAGPETTAQASAYPVVIDYPTPVPASVVTVVETAVARYSSILELDPDVPLHIEFRWEDMGSPTIGAYAGPTNLIRTSADVGAVPVALANARDGVDYVPGTADIVIGVNAGLPWHLESGPPPGNRVDLQSVLVHELGHGLGFVGSATGTSNETATLRDPMWAFDRRVSSGATPFPSLSVEARHAALTGNDLFIDVGDARYRLYAPATFANGSSFSHLDEATYPAGTPGSLMTPIGSTGEVFRTVDGPALAVLGAIGWTIRTSPAEPEPAPVTPPSIRRVPVGLATTIDEVVHATDYLPADADTLRLYRALLGRDPDVEGTKYWISESRRGVSLDSIAGAFSVSTEFQQTYGALTDHEFLLVVYRNVLGREPDPVGFDYWLTLLERGSLSRHLTVRYVAANDEFINRFPFRP